MVFMSLTQPDLVKNFPDLMLIHWITPVAEHAQISVPGLLSGVFYMIAFIVSVASFWCIFEGRFRCDKVRGLSVYVFRFLGYISFFVLMFCSFVLDYSDLGTFPLFTVSVFFGLTALISFFRARLNKETFRHVFQTSILELPAFSIFYFIVFSLIFAVLAFVLSVLSEFLDFGIVFLFLLLLSVGPAAMDYILRRSELYQPQSSSKAFLISCGFTVIMFFSPIFVTAIYSS